MSSTPSQTPEPEDRPWEERLRASEESSSHDHGKGGGMKDKKRRSGKTRSATELGTGRPGGSSRTVDAFV
jgi:hypothetical protein